VLCGRIPYKDHFGNVVGVIGISTDITERKRVEREIQLRSRQQAAIAKLGLRALASNDVSVLMDECVALLAHTLGTEYCSILRYLPEEESFLADAAIGWKGLPNTGIDSHAGYTLHSREPVIFEDISMERRFPVNPQLLEHGVVSGASVVIHGQNEPYGVLSTHTRSYRSFPQDDINFLQAVANVLAAAIERKRSEDQMSDVREAERQRIARNLHDEALQDLVYALQEMQETQAATKSTDLKDNLKREIETIERGILGLRNAIYDLRLEATTKGRTFVEMLEHLVELNRQNSPDCTIELFVEEDLPVRTSDSTATELLRIVQEALVNTRRHSGAPLVRVAVGVSDNKVWTEVSDDGRGFDPNAPTGLGIRGMQERARKLGGELEIRSKPGEGTKVRCSVPCKMDREAPEEVRILLVDDHASFRQGLASTLEREPGFIIVGEAGSLAEARKLFEGVDVAIVDLTLPDGYGGKLIKELRSANSSAIAFVLSANLDPTETARALELGAAGVLHKSANMDEVISAVHRLRAGESLLASNKIMDLFRLASLQREQEHEARQALARLTPRETEVLQALAEGLDSRQIAEQLHISVGTERNHMTNILAKLGVRSQTQALVFALRHGIVNIR
jgi:two-component system nitrate/nitrite response regulator NarL